MRVSKEREQPGQEWSPLLGAGWSVLWMEAEDTSSQRKFVLGGRKEPDQDSEKPVSEEAGFRHGNSRVRPAEPLPRRCCLAGWTLHLQLWVEGRAGKGAVWDWERRGGEEGGATPLCRPCREMRTLGFSEAPVTVVICGGAGLSQASGELSWLLDPPAQVRDQGDEPSPRERKEVTGHQ